MWIFPQPLRQLLRPCRVFGPSPRAASTRVLVLFLIVTTGLTALPAPAAAQTPSWLSQGNGSDEAGDGTGDGAGNGNHGGVPSLNEVRAARESVQERIDVLRAKVDDAMAAAAEQAAQAADASEDGPAAEGATAGPGSGPASDAVLEARAGELRLLEKTHSVLGQQIDELERTDTLANTAEDLGALRDAGFDALVSHPPPFGFDDLDAILGRLSALDERSRLLEDTVGAGAEAVSDAEARRRQAEQDRRLARERRDDATGTEQRQAELALAQAEARTRLAAEAEALQRLQLSNDRRELDLVDQRRAFLRSASAWIRDQLQPSEDSLKERLARNEEARQALRQRLDALRAEADRTQQQLLRSETRAGDDPDARASAQIDTLRQQLDLLERRQRLMEDAIERREAEADLWRLRHQLASSTPPQGVEREEVLDRIERQVTEFDRDQRLLRSRQEDLRATERRLEDQVLDPANADVADALRRLLASVSTQLALVEDEITDVSDLLSFARRVENEASEASLHVGELAGTVWRKLQAVWQWEITTVDDRSITLGKVFLALLLLIAGYKVSKRLASSLGRILQRRFGLSSGAAAALQNLAFYLLLVAFFLWALQLVSIPLTVFTLLGGVVAIGVGFGSQNVVNNFISGLILMMERPVKVGDLVEVDGTVGTVERIGLRSARVRAGDNTHVIVPNSTFLEQKVLNWTVTDDLVRTQVDVGVAYGSPTEKVAELMKKAVDDEPAVIHSMPVEILFMDFAADALLFRAYCWARVSGALDLVRVQSKIRFRIDEQFRDANITIAFPQRDVHLDTLSPLQIRLMRSDDDGPKSDAS